MLQQLLLSLTHEVAELVLPPLKQFLFALAHLPQLTYFFESRLKNCRLYWSFHTFFLLRIERIAVQFGFYCVPFSFWYTCGARFYLRNSFQKCFFSLPDRDFKQTLKIVAFLPRFRAPRRSETQGSKNDKLSRIKYKKRNTRDNPELPHKSSETLRFLFKSVAWTLVSTTRCYLIFSRTNALSSINRTINCLFLCRHIASCNNIKKFLVIIFSDKGKKKAIVILQSIRGCEGSKKQKK